ncbi:hypothetical protein DFS34DRAFT_421316 [Phlyctochytrium arcticum]|nr:hypothetical protein DFS34DRAFT_421316 [Phlyctochytrium arcticum]
MPVVKVNVKWSGKKLDDIEVDTDQPGVVFKTQLYTITGVPPERQKIMVKGGMLKDDSDINSLNWKEGQTLMMMGTAGELPKAPDQPIQFMEDMSDSQIAKALKLPAGLTNMGNTCYLNATLQCFRAMPELQTALLKMPAGMNADSRNNLAFALRSLFDELERSGDAVTPLMFLQLLRTVFPQFGEMDNRGYMQQDAEECWGQIVNALGEKVPGFTKDGEGDSGKKFVEQYMTGELINSLTCDEAPEESPSISTDTFNKLRVNIGAGVSTYMLTDIGKGLEEKIEKNSPSLGRIAQYTKKSKISRLPAYLAVNFVRFQWKQDIQGKAKILKKVKFPMDLDMTEFCTLDLMEKIRPAKLRIKEAEEEKANQRKAKKAKLDEAPGGASSSMDVDVQAEKKEDKKILSRTEELEKLKELGVDASLYNDVGANVSGQYELVAVLTHVGRAADSGHYIGWVKHTDDQWWKFDDDKVSQISPEDISKLEGGGDWHTAYICLYRSKRVFA